MSELKDYQEQKKRAELDSKIQLRMEMEGRNIFQDETLRRHRMSSGARVIVVLSVLLAVLLAVSLTVVPYGLFSSALDSTDLYLNYSASIYRDVVLARVEALLDYVTTGGSSTVQFVIFTQIVVILAGMALSASGAAYQGVFQNPMSSPTTLGVQAGGTIGGLIFICFFADTSLFVYNSDVVIYADELIAQWRSQTIWQLCAQQLFTLAGCFLGVMLIVGVAFLVGRGKINTVALMLCGSVFSSAISQVSQLVQYLVSIGEDENKATMVTNLLGGRFAAQDFAWYEALLMGIPVVLGLAVLFTLGKKLNVMVFGADDARTMGLNVTTFRNLIIVVCTILTAVVMSFCGQLTMLGFMMPHFARYLVGPDFRYLVPVSTLLGGITTLVVYDVCYMTGMTERFNMYTGVICSVMSVLFILFYRRNRHADWA
ncbi:MAG: iron ABC transporter permease [Oscillospiraceae bacterium]|nr:iron ABC transporter permease [Oscillospiraceae bacterium]